VCTSQCGKSYYLLVTVDQHNYNHLIMHTAIVIVITIIIIIILITKRLCILGPKGAIQIRYYYYYCHPNYFVIVIIIIIIITIIINWQLRFSLNDYTACLTNICIIIIIIIISTPAISPDWAKFGVASVVQQPKFKILLHRSFVTRPIEYTCQVSSTSAQRSRSGALGFSKR